MNRNYSLYELSRLWYFTYIIEQDNLWIFISFPFDEKKRNKPACQAQATAKAGREKSRQNNASTRIAFAPSIGRHRLADGDALF